MKSDPRVLEIGCGQGGFGARISRRADYLGVEADSVSFEVARRWIDPAGGRVVHGTLDLVDPHERFDLVCAFEVIEHIEDDLAALTDWVARLTPGGTVIVSAPAWPQRYGAWDDLVGHYRRYTPDQIESVLSNAGCARVEHVLYGWPLGFVTEPARNVIARRRKESAGPHMSDRTAASGRMLQPKRLAGMAIRAGIEPFVALQRMRPSVGVGVIGMGRRTA